jgi:integrase
VRYAHSVLSLVLAHAVRDGRLSRNPADGVRLPRVVREEPIFLDHDQVAALAEARGRYGARFATPTRARMFQPAAESVGLAGVTPHDLRHTAASLAVAAGAGGGAVADLRKRRSPGR